MSEIPADKVDKCGNANSRISTNSEKINFIKFLIKEKNIDLNAMNKSAGSSPLDFAAIYDNVPVTDLLLKNSAD